MEKRNSSLQNIFVMIAVLVASCSLGTSATPKDKEEKKVSSASTKRQDDAFSSVFFGGWTPLKPGSPYFHGSQSGKYHDLLSAIPEPLDTSSTYHSSSLPNYNKDIYNYYPKPAIKSKPKSKAPLYMENFSRRYKNQKSSPQGQTQGGYQALDIPGLEGIDIGHLKQLQEALLSAHQLPLTPINLPLDDGKGVKFIEIAIHPLPEGGHVEHVRPRPRGKGGYRQGGRRNRGNINHKVPQTHLPPLNIQYLQVPAVNVKNEVNYETPKELPVVPVQVPQVEEVIDLKNVQIVEVPVPIGPHEVSSIKSVQSSHYGKIQESSDYGKSPETNVYSEIQGSTGYKFPEPSSYGKSIGNSEYSRGASISHVPNYESASPTKKQQQPQQHGSRSTVYFPPSKSARHYSTSVQQEYQRQEPKYSRGPVSQSDLAHQIEAELVEITEEQIKNLLKSLQASGKDPNELLTYIPLSDIKGQKEGDVHLVLAVPQDNVYPISGEKNIQYETVQQPQSEKYGYRIQAAEKPKSTGYETSQYSTSSEEYSPQVNVYSTKDHQPKLHQVSAGYQVSDKYKHSGRDVAYHQPTYPKSQKGNSYAQVAEPESSYQKEPDSGHRGSSYQSGSYDARAAVGGHQGSGYQGGSYEVGTSAGGHQGSGYQGGSYETGTSAGGHQGSGYQGGSYETGTSAGGHQGSGYQGGSYETGTSAGGHQGSGYQGGSYETGTSAGGHQGSGYQGGSYEAGTAKGGHQGSGYERGNAVGGHQVSSYQSGGYGGGSGSGGHQGSGYQSGSSGGHQGSGYQSGGSGGHQGSGYQSGGYGGGSGSGGHQGSGYQSGGYGGESGSSDHQGSGYQSNGYGGGSGSGDHQGSGYPSGGGYGGGSGSGDHQGSSYQSGGYGGASGSGGHQGSGYQSGSYDGGTVVGYKRDSSGQAYIEVHAQPDENGYKREPVLAVELKKGQTVEDAIQALDPETLQRLGAHSKDGVEIEIVEFPVDEYASESRKRVTIVAKTNSTITDTSKSTTKMASTTSATTTATSSTTTVAPS